MIDSIFLYVVQSLSLLSSKQLLHIVVVMECVCIPFHYHHHHHHLHAAVEQLHTTSAVAPYCKSSIHFKRSQTPNKVADTTKYLLLL